MILVTGGCGFIGAALVKTLVKRGEEVRVLDNMSRGRMERLQGVKCDVMCGDVCNYGDVRYAAQGVDEIIHLACVNGTQNFYDHPDKVLQVGVKGTQIVIDVINEFYIPKFIFVSSSEVYHEPLDIPTTEAVVMKIPDPWNPRYSYAAVKIIGEMMTIHNCVASSKVILRPHNIYGPDMGHGHVIPKLFDQIITGQPVKFASDGPPTGRSLTGTFYGPTETRAFCYIADCIEQIMLVRSKNNYAKNIYNIGTEDEITIAYLAESIALLLGKVPQIEYGYSPNHGAGGAMRRCPNMSLLRGLGYIQQFSLNDGLALTIEWYKQEYDNARRTMPELQQGAAAHGS